MHEVCSRCSNDCIRAEPVTIEGDPIKGVGDIICCYRFSCIEGLRAAKRAFKMGVAEKLVLYNGSVVEGMPFGTEDKPTDDMGEFRRYVTLDGDIVANNGNGELFYTGQNVFRRRR